MTTKRLTKAEREKKAAVFEAQQKEDQMLRDAESFGRACRREHDALRALLIMLSHIKGMPVVQETINEADAAYMAVAQAVAGKTKPVAGLLHIPSELYLAPRQHFPKARQ